MPRFQRQYQIVFGPGGPPFMANDGGRSKYFDKQAPGDCVVRAIAIALERDYLQVYDALNQIGKTEIVLKGRRSNSRNGVRRRTYEKYLEKAGWEWVATTYIGSGCKVHLRSGELPPGRIIVRLSKHMAAVVDGVLHDTHDCSRNGTRCVYGYFRKRGGQ